jgi:hypothetical protein
MSKWMRGNDGWTEGNKKAKVAPIQVERYPNYGRGEIPYEVAEEAYKEYAAKYGTSQSLERLNERGGFGWAELAILLFERCKRLSEK